MSTNQGLPPCFVDIFFIPKGRGHQIIHIFATVLLSRDYKMTKMIEHKGLVRRISDDHVEVMIIQKSACAGCHAKSACSASDMAEKIIEVTYTGNDLKPGDEVTLIGSESMGWKAVGYAFLLPFIVLLTTLIVATELLENELTAGIVALGILIPYYLILYCFRNRMRKKFSFTLKT